MAAEADSGSDSDNGAWGDLSDGDDNDSHEHSEVV